MMDKQEKGPTSPRPSTLVHQNDDTRDGDGALARFLSSILATVITLIFSWRLLQEYESNDDPPGPSRRPAIKANTSNDSTPLKQNTSAIQYSRGNHGNLYSSTETAVWTDAGVVSNNINVVSRSTSLHHALYDNNRAHTILSQTSDKPRIGVYAKSFLEYDESSVDTSHKELDGSRCLRSGVIIPTNRDSYDSSGSDTDSTLANDDDRKGDGHSVPINTTESEESLGGRFPSQFINKGSDDELEIESDLEYDYTGHERSYTIGDIETGRLIIYVFNLQC